MIAPLVQAYFRATADRLPGQTLALTPGQAVVGEILDQLTGREVIVRIAGHTLRAYSEVPLEAGTRHWFQVQPDREHVVLKVVTRSQHPLKRPVLPTVPALLEYWGVKPSKPLVQAAKWLMRHDLPLTKESASQLATIWRKFGSSPATKQAVLLTLSKHLPLNAQTVSAVRQMLSGRSLLDQLRHLSRQLQMWVEREEALPRQVREQVNMTLRQIASLPGLRQPGAAPEAVPSSRMPPASQAAKGDLPPPPLPEETSEVPLTRRHGIFAHEKNSNQASASRQPGREHPMSRQSGSAVSSLANHAMNSVSENRPVTASFIKKWLAALGMQREGHLSRFLHTAAGTSAVTSEMLDAPPANVKESLMRLMQLRLPAPIRETADGLIRHVTGQQLLLSTTQEAQSQHLLLHIPFLPAEGREASVHVFTRRQANGKLDKDNCRLLLQLDLERLGPVTLHVHIVDRRVHIDWYGDEDRLPDVGAMEADLREQLQSVGYRLSGIRVKPASPQSGTPPQNWWLQTTPGGKGVDIRI